MALNPYIGYGNATAVAQEAHSSGRSVYEVVIEKGLLSKEGLSELLRPEVLTRPQQILLPDDAAPQVGAADTVTAASTLGAGGAAETGATLEAAPAVNLRCRQPPAR